MSDYLIFVDTNIFLDFYRVRKESGLSLLKKLSDIDSKLIITSQVEMEFKKNRQHVALSYLNELSKCKTIQPAAFLADTKNAQALEKTLKEANKRITNIKGKINNLFIKPNNQDPVYKETEKLFNLDSPYNLDRTRKERFQLRRLAWKRFILGYPPRKKNDTSIGDAINWEWIIHCAKESKQNIVIVSRDSDFGTSHANKCYLNDWLLDEFKDRVAKRRKIHLVDRLSAAFKHLDIRITKYQEKEEADFISRRRKEISESRHELSESTLETLFKEVGLEDIAEQFSDG